MEALGLRITPAWAGKSTVAQTSSTDTTDYPRVGGEEVGALAGIAGTAGLPPRGRGRAFWGRKRDRAGRITPAWAGKRSRLWIIYTSRRDYPRVGGEESVISSTTAFVSGLPPRGRGRANINELCRL